MKTIRPSATEQYWQFRVEQKAYTRTGALIVSFISTGLLLAAIAGSCISYIYVKFPSAGLFSWQTLIIVSILYFICVCLGCCILAGKLLRMLWEGNTQAMIEIHDSAVAIRDVSFMNLGSIFWFGTALFSCFIVTIIGVTPSLLLPYAFQHIHTTSGLIVLGAIGLLALIGIVISVVSTSFVIIGWIGSISFMQQLGAMHTYPFTNESQIQFRKKNILACAYSNKRETIVDLQMLSSHDREEIHAILEGKHVLRQEEQGGVQVRPTNIFLNFIHRTRPLTGVAE